MSTFKGLWSAPQFWRYVAVVAVTFALTTVGASAASAALATFQIGWLTPSGGTNVAHIDGNGNLQVGGTVNVGNLPTTQTVSGTVNVANLPSTAVLADVEFQQVAENSVNILATFDATDYRTIRITTDCGIGASPYTVRLIQRFQGGFLGALDSFQACAAGVSDTKTYDVPGREIAVQIENSNSSPIAVTFSIWGRQ
jgi:hypothetical protein